MLLSCLVRLYSSATVFTMSWTFMLINTQHVWHIQVRFATYPILAHIHTPGLLSTCVWQALLEGWYRLSQSVGIPLREWLLLMCGVRIPFGNCSRQFSSGFMLQILDHHGILHAQPMNPIDTAKELLETAIHTNLESRPSFRAVILSCLRAVIWRLGEKYRFSIWDPSSIPWEYNTKQRGDLQLAAVPWFRVLNNPVSGVCRVNIVFFPDVPM